MSIAAVRLTQALAFALTAASCSVSSRPAPLAPAERVHAIAREVEAWNDSVAGSRPAWSAWLGEPIAVRDARVQRTAAWVRQLDAVDRRALGDGSDALLHVGLREGLARQAATAVCRDEFLGVSPLGGLHLNIALTAGNAARDSAGVAAVAERFASVPDAMDEHLSRLREGSRLGYTASRDNVDRVLEQLELLTTQLREPNRLPLVEGARRISPTLADRLAAQVRDDVSPAIAEYLAYLKAEYVAKARAEGSLSTLPNGRACYEARLAVITGVDTPPDSLAQVAVERLAAIDAELAPILRRLVGDVPLAEAKRRLRTDARFLHSSREEMISEAQALEARLTPAVSRLFRNPPTVPLEIVRTPAVREASDAPARYGRPRGPGQPGTFFLNTYRPDSQPRWNLPVAVAHEGSPGHHFEATYPRSVDVPPAARGFGLGSYSEGWGIYAEEVAVRESGVLSDDLSRAGLLMHYIDGWNALELDIRMHLDGWTRERVIARTMEATGKSRRLASVYADRHAASAGQLASYMIGYLRIRQMREAAERALGDRFDVRDFHERYLEAGPLPLPVVQQRMQDWITEVRRTSESQAPPTVITNVTVIPGDRDARLPGRIVVIDGGRIVSIGTSVSAELLRSARVINGTGKYLAPGLVEMHFHFAPGDGEVTDGAGRQLRSALAAGVTTGRALIAPASALEVRDRIARGELLGPTLYVAAPSLNGNSTPDATTARTAVRQAKERGFDVLKTHGGFGAEVYDAIVDEARRQGLPLSGHVSAGYGLERALAAGQQVEHLDGYIAASLRAGGPVPGGQVIADEEVLARVDYARIAALAERTRAAGVWNGFTLALFQNVAGRWSLAELQALPEMRQMPAAAVAQWSNQIAGMQASGASPAGLATYMAVRDSIAVALYRAGARFFVSSDSPQLFLATGAGTLREMEAMQHAGIPAWAVLKAATADAQEYLGRRDVGRVVDGQRADLLLLDADPLEDIANVRQLAGVMVGGRWLPRAELDRMVADVEANVPR